MPKTKNDSILDIPVILTPLSGDIDPPNIGLVQRA
jgi:hypothetical protein